MTAKDDFNHPIRRRVILENAARWARGLTVGGEAVLQNDVFGQFVSIE